MKKAYSIFLNAIPVLVMIGLIPLVPNDYVLALLDVAIVIVALVIRRERNEITILIAGFFIMIVCEFLFVSTGVETFVRHSLLGFMPLWLPVLWSYGFVAIKRGGEILSK